MELEGIVAKDAKSSYIEVPQLTRHWLKIKNPSFERKEPIEFKAKAAERVKDSTNSCFLKLECHHTHGR
jgi:ATP-dependent DNA ligase